MLHLDQQTEEAIALDVAAGMPTVAILERHNLPSEQTLIHFLERPRIERMVEANRSRIHDAAARMYLRKAVAADAVMDVLLRRAVDPQDRQQHTIGQWVVDSLAPPTSRLDVTVRNAPTTEMMNQFIEAVGELREVFARPVHPLPEPSTKHLHVGREFIAQRDHQLVAGTGTSGG